MKQLAMIIGMVAVSGLVSCGGSRDAVVAEPAPVQEESALAPVQAGVFPYTIHQTELDNGLNVVTVPYESGGLASFYIVVRVGSREEVEEGKTGFAHFFEHMMFRGTDNYSKEEYGNVLKSTGAGANANTWLDRTVYHMTGNAEKLDVMFELEADRFQNLNYSVGDFKVEAGAVKGEYTKNYASQFRQINEAMVNAAFENHTYKHTTMGFFEDIVEMPNQYEYSLTFYDRFYRPEYTTIIVVGDVTPGRVNALAQEYFGEWERGTYEPQIPEEPEQTETKYAHIQNENFIPYISLGYKTPAFSDTEIDAATMELISTMAFSKRSDLYQKLVVDEQVALELFASYFGTRDPYLFEIAALAKDEKDLQYIKDAINTAITELQSQPVDAQLLQDTKQRIINSFVMSVDNPESIAETLTYFTWLTGDPESVNRYYALYDQITPADVQRVARDYFRPEKLTIATISSKENGGVK